MCIMEVREGQHSTTIAQAMAHNTSTIERDLDMFLKLLKARGEAELVKAVEHAQTHLKHAYATFLEIYGEELYHEVHHQHSDSQGREKDYGHEHQADGTERSLTEQEHHDASLARKFETR